MNDDATYLRLAIAESARAMQQGGGPFGAVIAGEHEGKAFMLSAGNCVAAAHDPTAHAEITVLRRAAEEEVPLAAATLYSSCECCPMCLAMAQEMGVRRIRFAATRDDAAQAGFSDALQYRLSECAPGALMTPLVLLPQAAQSVYRTLLADYEAVVISSDNQLLSAVADRLLPPSFMAIRAATIALQSGPWLPPGVRLITRQIPHPAGIMAADWARILRPRNARQPDNPAADSPSPDPQQIIHLQSSMEGRGNGKAADIASLPAQQAAAQAIFAQWREGVRLGQYQSY